MDTMHKNVRDTIYLASCAVNNKIPEGIDKMDLEGIYEIASRHLIGAVISQAILSTGITDKRANIYISKAIRNTILMDREMDCLIKKLEKSCIWYMPLKGAVLKDYYPKYGMREMIDHDILYDAERYADVKSIMEELGFQTKRFKVSNHDIYLKKPFINFEMHRSLFSSSGAFHETELLMKYYEEVKKRLIKDNDNNYGYHFSQEDFYIYMIAHEYKHFIRGGIGIRSLLDTYVYLKHFTSLNWDYIQKEMETVEITDFEKSNRKLALNLFDKGMVNDEETLAYMLDSGAFGSMENFVNNRLKRSGNRLSYIMKRIILPMETVEKVYPFFSRHKVLLPLLPFYRLYLVKRKGNSTLGAEIKMLKDK